MSILVLAQCPLFLNPVYLSPTLTQAERPQAAAKSNRQTLPQSLTSELQTLHGGDLSPMLLLTLNLTLTPCPSDHS